jgi:hypothetical protein
MLRASIPPRLECRRNKSISTNRQQHSHVNTTGFKQGRAEFQDLLYQNLRPAGTASSASTEYPVGLQLGWVRGRLPRIAFIVRATSVRPEIPSTL